MGTLHFDSATPTRSNHVTREKRVGSLLILAESDMTIDEILIPMPNTLQHARDKVNGRCVQAKYCSAPFLICFSFCFGTILH